MVSDQIGSPTYATDLADAILEIIKHKKFRDVGQTTQIYHYSNEGEVSWYEFSKEIFKIARMDCKVNPFASQQYPTLAKRPRNSLKNKDKIKQRFGEESKNWKNSIYNFIINQQKGLV